jgi:hypothetical protein
MRTSLAWLQEETAADFTMQKARMHVPSADPSVPACTSREQNWHHHACSRPVHRSAKRVSTCETEMSNDRGRQQGRHCLWTTAPCHNKQVFLWSPHTCLDECRVQFQSFGSVSDGAPVLLCDCEGACVKVHACVNVWVCKVHVCAFACIFLCKCGYGVWAYVSLRLRNVPHSPQALHGTVPCYTIKQLFPAMISC